MEREGRHARYAFAKAGDFDIVHNHSWRITFSSRQSCTDCVNCSQFKCVYRQFKSNLYIAISQDNGLFSGFKKDEVIYHGINLNDFPFEEKARLSCLGWTILPRKGVHHAIKVTQARYTT